MFAAWILRYRTIYMAETLYMRKLKSYNMRVAVEEKNKRGRAGKNFALARAMHKTSLITFCKINYRFSTASLSLPEGQVGNINAATKKTGGAYFGGEI